MPGSTLNPEFILCPTMAAGESMSNEVGLQTLLQEIRLHAPPVTAETLAAAVSVSVRTIYRDIQTLRESAYIALNHHR